MAEELLLLPLYNKTSVSTGGGVGPACGLPATREREFSMSEYVGGDGAEGAEGGGGGGNESKRSVYFAVAAVAAAAEPPKEGYIDEEEAVGKAVR